MQTHDPKQTHDEPFKPGIDELSELLAAGLGMPRPGAGPNPPKRSQGDAVEPRDARDPASRRTH